MRKSEIARMSDTELARAYKEHTDALQSQEHAYAAGRRPIPFDGSDRTGMPDRPDLGRMERRAWLGIVPRKSAWPELDRFDSRIAELQRRHAEAQERVRSLTEQRVIAPQADADRLAAWELADRKGPKPESTVDALDRQIADAERDRDGLDTALDRALEEKASYVEKNRDRLVAVAEQQTGEAHARMRAMIDELEATREALADVRQQQVWAALYPDELCAGEPQVRIVAGGLAQPVVQTLGLNPPPQLDAAKLLELLRRDADALKTAATPEQLARLEGREIDPARGAAWVGSEKDTAQRKAARQAAREAHYREWGQWPNY